MAPKTKLTFFLCPVVLFLNLVYFYPALPIFRKLWWWDTVLSLEYNIMTLNGTHPVVLKATEIIWKILLSSLIWELFFFCLTTLTNCAQEVCFYLWHKAYALNVCAAVLASFLLHFCCVFVFYWVIYFWCYTL